MRVGVRCELHVLRLHISRHNRRPGEWSPGRQVMISNILRVDYQRRIAPGTVRRRETGNVSIVLDGGTAGAIGATVSVTVIGR
jgi:hypothetical protein